VSRVSNTIGANAQSVANGRNATILRKFKHGDQRRTTKGTEGVKASDDEALDAVLQAGRVEIQQQPDADRLMRGSQNLRFVCRDEGRDTFDFKYKYNGIRDQNIGPEPE
jgi:hypothetical protein